MTNRFDYSRARWNRLSRSVRRLDDDTVEIKVSDSSLLQLGFLFIILQLLGFAVFHLYSISGERVFPSRPSSISTLREMLKDDYTHVTDFETWLIPYRDAEIEQWNKKNLRFAGDPHYEPEPLATYDEFYQDYANWLGHSPWYRFAKTISSLGLGQYIFGLLLAVPFKLFLPGAAPVRLDARRRAVYGRSWYGLVLKRFFGLGDLRADRNGKAPSTLEALKFRRDFDPEYCADWQNRRQTRIQRLFYPFRRPAMIHLRDQGWGPYQRFALGAYPQRKNQAEELEQFIEDYFDHPNPGEWTKNLRYRWPVWGDLRGWIIGFNLYPCPHYNEGKALGKLKKCLAFLDQERRIKRKDGEYS